MGNKKLPKTWIDKLDQEKIHKVKHIEKRFVDIPENSEMLIATPKIFEDYIYKIKKGISVSMKKVRFDLAKVYKAENTCPVTTGIFLRIVAEANYEKYKNGESINKIAPFWRVIDENSSIAKKLSFGIDFIKEQRNKEGIKSIKEKV